MKKRRFSGRILKARETIQQIKSAVKGIKYPHEMNQKNDTRNNIIIVCLLGFFFFLSLLSFEIYVNKHTKRTELTRLLVIRDFHYDRCHFVHRNHFLRTNIDRICYS
jgi:hypothetical protein